MNFKTLAVAAALVAAGTANAAISSFSGGTAIGNGSLVLLMLDDTGDATQSLTVDLGLNFSDFANGGRFSKAGTSIIWNLAANTVTGETRPNLSVAGTAISFTETNNWASQLSIFQGNSDAAETKWAVISGAQKTSVANAFLTTAPLDDASDSVPTTSVAQFTQVTSKLIGSLGNKGTITSAANGAYSAAATDLSYVGTAYETSDGLGWLGNSAWATWGDIGTSLHFKQVNANGGAFDVGQTAIDPQNIGTFTLQGNTLTYTVGVPEPESYALAIVGLLGMAAVARRRAAK
jgi:hypothetical protein